jgi:hypothetical protein
MPTTRIFARHPALSSHTELGIFALAYQDASAPIGGADGARWTPRNP